MGMAGELPVGNCLRGRGAVGAEGKVAGAAAGNQAIIAVEHDAGAAEVVAKDIEQAVVAADRVAADASGDALASSRCPVCLKDEIVEGCSFLRAINGYVHSYSEHAENVARRVDGRSARQKTSPEQDILL
jgi:hypothetical protein